MREHGVPDRRRAADEKPTPGGQPAGNEKAVTGAHRTGDKKPVTGAQPAVTPLPTAELGAGAGYAPVTPGTGYNRGAQARKPAQSVALLAFLAGLLMMTLAFTGSLLWGGTSQRLYTDAINATLVSGGVLTQRDADAFAAETIAYLTGAKAGWQPTVTLGDHELAVPEAFRTHMATVRGWVQTIGAALPALAVLALALLMYAVLITRRKPGNRFPARAYRWGAAVPLALLAGLCLCAALDFAGLWVWLHETFIPDGIFPAGEEIMRLFPIALFQRYLAPVGGLFTLCAAAVLALPLLLQRLTYSAGGKR